MKRITLTAFAAILLPALASAQEPGTTFQTDAVLVELEVKVTGSGGEPAGSLASQDFTVFENGKPQTIRTFEYVPSLEGRYTQAGPGAVRQPVWLYIGTFVGSDVAPRVREAVRRFIAESLPEGAAVSLNGSRFEFNRQRLLELAGDASLSDIESGTLYSEQFDTGGAAGEHSDRSVQSAPAGQAGKPATTAAERAAEAKEIDRARPVLTARAQLYRQIDLVRQMARLPGKKVIVIFSYGLRVRQSAPESGRDLVEGDLTDLYSRLSAEAARHRVSIYPVDARGLEAIVQGGDASFSEATRGDRIRGLIGPPAVNADDRRMTQHGLATVAELTGGRALLNSSGLGEVFDYVRRDLGGYYLIGYYSSDKTQQGRQRKLRVTVNRPDARLDYRKAYYEETGFQHLSGKERRKQIEEILMSDIAHAALPLDAAFHFRQDVVSFTAAPVAGAPWRLAGGDSRTVHYTFLASARDPEGKRKPVFTEVSVKKSFSEEEWQRVRQAPAGYFRFPGEMRLEPGRWLWKAVVRDESTGATGTYQSRLLVPGVSSGVTSSSLLVTPHLVDARQPGTAQEGTIPFKAVRLLPAPASSFERGVLLFMQYDIYNAPDQMLRTPPAPRVYLLREEEELSEPPFQGYEFDGTTAQGTLRYLAALDTAKLEPGQYRLVVPLPDGENAIFREFALEEGRGSGSR